MDTQSEGLRKQIALLQEEVRQLRQLSETVINEISESGTGESFVEYLAPSRELAKLAVEVMQLTPGDLYRHFEQCAGSTYPGIDLEFMQWFAHHYKIKQWFEQRYAHRAVYDYAYRLRAFARACDVGHFEIAKWIFTEFNIAANSDADLQEMVYSLRHEVHDNSKGRNSEGRKHMAGWIAAQIEAARQTPS